jgi:hypothetical protein
MPSRTPRSTLSRAVLPVLGGLAFFVVLGLATWGIAAVLSDNPERINDRLAADTFDVGDVDSLSSIIADEGPLIFPDLVRTGGTRTIVLDHTGDDPTRGWRIYYAYPADRELTCKVTQVRGTRQFVDCEGRTLDVEDLAPPVGVNPLVSDRVVIDLRGANALTTTTVAGTTGT